MCKTLCVLALAALYLGLAHSWDIAVSVRDQLIFYTGGRITNTVNVLSHNLAALAYDEVRDMMLYVDKQSEYDAICGYYLRSKENTCFIKRVGGNIESIAFDPATDKLFFTDTNERSIYWVSLKPGSNNNINGNLLMKMDDSPPSDIAVDSCRGNIYWTYLEVGYKYMERARLNGSERTILNRRLPILSLAVDPQTREIHYFDGCDFCRSEFLNTADLVDGNDRIRFYHSYYSAPKQLTVSKDYLYWVNSSDSYSSVWQYPKNATRDVEPKEFSKFYTERPLGIAANYRIKDQIQGLQDCEVLSSLLSNISERCDVSVCENYCLQGDCSCNDEGLPKCRCNAGYSGERCEVYACHGYCLNNGTCFLNDKNEPVCQCKGDYVGDRCEVSDCLNYCLQGNCSFNDEGLPKCRCNAGYSGERCEVYACHGYCLNSGDCAMNEKDEPVCECVGNHEGTRCEAVKDDTLTSTPTFIEKSKPTLADLLSKCVNYCLQGVCSFSDDGPLCSCNAGYSGKRCEVYACYGYCLNNGICSLNEEDEPFCQCVDNHEGTRCEAAINDTFTNTPFDSVKRNLPRKCF